MSLTRRRFSQFIVGGACLAMSGASARALSTGSGAAWMRYENLIDALLTTSSATATLSELARSRGWDPQIVATKLEADNRPAPAAIAKLLQVADGAVIGYRKVALGSGERVLSLAENWFVPGRLAAGVNASLDAGREPFGRLIARLDPSRRVLSSERMWASATTPVPGEVFQMSAVVMGAVDAGRAPLAIVREAYQAVAVV